MYPYYTLTVSAVAVEVLLILTYVNSLSSFNAFEKENDLESFGVSENGKTFRLNFMLDFVIYFPIMIGTLYGMWKDYIRVLRALSAFTFVFCFLQFLRATFQRTGNTQIELVAEGDGNFLIYGANIFCEPILEINENNPNPPNEVGQCRRALKTRLTAFILLHLNGWLCLMVTPILDDFPYVFSNCPPYESDWDSDLESGSSYSSDYEPSEMMVTKAFRGIGRLMKRSRQTDVEEKSNEDQGNAIEKDIEEGEEQDEGMEDSEGEVIASGKYAAVEGKYSNQEEGFVEDMSPNEMEEGVIDSGEELDDERSARRRKRRRRKRKNKRNARRAMRRRRRREMGRVARRRAMGTAGGRGMGRFGRRRGMGRFGGRRGFGRMRIR